MSTPYRLKTKGLTVNLRVQGTGPKLLFLGGSNFDLSIKAPVFDSALKDHFTIAAADPRGLGATDAPDGAWTMQDYAQDALDVLDALGWEQAYVLGESFGAMTALHLAALAPERIIRMALSAGSAGGDGGSSYPVQTLRNISEPRARARKALEIQDDRFKTLFDRNPTEAQERISARVKSEDTFLTNGQNADSHPKLLTARAGHDAWKSLPNIAVPTLVFAGSHDQQAPVARSENIVNAMPDATLHIIDGGHTHCFGTPAPVATILQHWTN